MTKTIKYAKNRDKGVTLNKKAVKAAKPKKPDVARPAKAQNIDKALAEIKVVIDARYRIARAVYDAQDGLTKEVLDRLVDRLRIAATGVVSINGQPYKIEQEYQDFNLLFIATEILSDLALNGIQVANFNFHPAYCAECKEEIAKVPRKKKVRR